LSSKLLFRQVSFTSHNGHNLVRCNFPTSTFNVLINPSDIY
jgi:hypothetical protein